MLFIIGDSIKSHHNLIFEFVETEFEGNLPGLKEINTINLGTEIVFQFNFFTNLMMFR
jgi:hypothetical protein